MDDQRVVETLKIKPKKLPFKCPSCNGWGSVGYAKKLCPSCNGKGVIIVDQKEKDTNFQEY